jgi:hypothetical protein
LAFWACVLFLFDDANTTGFCTVVDATVAATAIAGVTRSACFFPLPWKDNAGNADCLCLDFKARFLNVNHLGLKRAVAARTFFARAADVDFCVHFFSVCCIGCDHGNHNQQTVDTGTIHGLAFRIDLTLSD